MPPSKRDPGDSPSPRPGLAGPPVITGALWVVAGLLLVNGVMLAVTLVLSREAQDHGLSPVAYGFWMTLGGGLLLSFAALWRRPRAPTTGQVRYWLTSGLLSLALPQLLVFIAVTRVGVGLASITFVLPTLTTWFIARIMGIERPSRLRLAGALIATTGATWLVIPSAALPPGAAPWMLLLLVASLALTAGNIYRRVAWPVSARPVELAAGMLMAASLMFLLPALALGTELAFWELEGVAAIVLAQVLLSAVHFFAYYVLQQRATPVTFSLLGHVTLVAGMAGGALLLGERYPPAALIAVGAIFTGLLFMVMPRRAG
jgi:drug/metabolite transporter (DMT)-like permease